jgi:hypothetical protein
MTNPLPIPDQLWNQGPPDTQAASAAVFRAMPQRINDLEARGPDLETRLKLNSTNSSTPPSSDPIGWTRKPAGAATGAKTRRPARTSEGPTHAGPARGGAIDHRLHAHGGPPVGSRPDGRRPGPRGPSGRRTAPERAERGRGPRAPPELPAGWRDDRRRLARGGPHRRLRPLPPRHPGDAGRCLPPQPTADPANGRSRNWSATWSAGRSPPG